MVDAEAWDENLANEPNIPLDRYTLEALKRCIPAVVLHRNPSMGAITSEEGYVGVQTMIRHITETARVPNLYFELWASRNTLAWGLY